jgi:hypothetical protein
MTVQTEYRENLKKGTPGLIQGTDYNTQSVIVETAAGIAFGKPVSKGTGETGVVLGGAVAGFRGITVRDVALGAETDTYAQYKTASILKRGTIMVEAGADGIAAGDDVYYNATTGVWSNSAGGNVGPILRARFASGGDTGDIVLVELDVGNQNS